MTLNPTLGTDRRHPTASDAPSTLGDGPSPGVAPAASTAASTAALDREEILADYRIAVVSREASLLGRREVLTGKAKFGIFGDGKEVAQLAMARAFRPGDFRSGYYRDQTFHFALGLTDVEGFFAQLYAHADLAAEPISAGRQMTAHFGTRSLDEHGHWRALTELMNSSADLSPTASQMPRLVGLAYASRLYRQLPELTTRHPVSNDGFSRNGNEIAFGTIGNGSCAEGLFWESVNAIGVLRAPAVISIWDDGYGISVPNEYQITHSDLSRVLQGFARKPGEEGGFELFRVPGWDYPALCAAYRRAAELARTLHVPSILHVTEVTQPQGHSTSGSHERYKPAERLVWEKDFDCIVRMRDWMIENGVASAPQLDALEQEERSRVRERQQQAWEAFRRPTEERMAHLDTIAATIAEGSPKAEQIAAIRSALGRKQTPGVRDILAAAHEVLIVTLGESSAARSELAAWYSSEAAAGSELYASDLYCDTERSALAVPVVEPRYDAGGDASGGEGGEQLRGFEVLNAFFEHALERDPTVIALGQDVGKLGDVNQGFAGLQAKFGELRVSDTGIREATIAGQAIGMAMRGLRPIAEIQYLDYILYALQILSDDLATVRWRTAGGQMAPVILRTRGHRLEGIWHSGSPMAALLALLRGTYLCVPRDMTRAAGMYNTLLQADDPAVVIEVLNGYRIKEPVPTNLTTMTVPLGIPEVLRQGTDVTVVTYGACCKIALDAAQLLAGAGVETEVVDVQTLLPFDREARIVESLKKTNRILFLDEDVPGGASAYMLRHVLETQGGYHWLDHAPRTETARQHRPPYGSDGDYASKPNRETVFRAVYEMVREGRPQQLPPMDG